MSVTCSIWEDNIKMYLHRPITRKNYWVTVNSVSFLWAFSAPSAVASGDFHFAKWPFILNYGLRCKVPVFVCGLCHSPQETTHAPTPHPFLERISRVPFCLKLFLKSCLIEMSRACIFGDLWPYLVARRVLPTPYDVTCPQILMLFNLGNWKPQGTFLVVTCHRNRYPIA